MLPLLFALAIVVVVSVPLLAVLGALDETLLAVGGVVVLAAVLGIMIAGGVMLVRDTERARRPRVDDVARALGLRHTPRRRPQEIVQLAAGRGARAVLYSVLETVDEEPVTVANFSASVGLLLEPVVPASGDRRRVVHRGIVTASLGRSLPHIALRSRSRRWLLERLRDRVGGQRRLSIGALDGAFAVYCPEGYERDALYLLTPDVAADLIDGFSGSDVHIIDDMIVAVSPAPFDLTDVSITRRLLESMRELRSEITDQAARYRDGRVAQPSHVLGTPNTSISPQARRLRSRVSDVWLALILGAVPLAALVVLIVAGVVSSAG